MEAAKRLGIEAGVRVLNRGDMANDPCEGVVVELVLNGTFVSIAYDDGGKDVCPIGLFTRPAMGGKPRLMVLPAPGA